MKVYLYALPKLDPTRSVAVFRDISDSLVSDMVQVMQDLEDYREEIQDFVGSVVYNHFPHIANKVNTFLDLVRRYQQNFNLQVRTLLPQIRGTRQEENELDALVQTHYVSSFSKSTIDNWFRILHAETAVLKSFVDLLMPLRYASNEGEYITHISTNDQVISINLYFPVRSDPTLDDLMRFVDEANHVEARVHAQEWYQQPTILIQILKNIRDIVQYRQANKDSPISFIYAVIAHGYSHLRMPSSEIKASNSTRSTDREESNLVLPGEPRDLMENTDEDGNTIRWQPPHYGADYIERYAIVVRERGSRTGQTPIEYLYHTSSYQTEFHIAIPESVPYDVHVYGLCRIGRTASSDVLHHSGTAVRLVGGAEICCPRIARGWRIEVGGPFINLMEIFDRKIS